MLLRCYHSIRCHPFPSHLCLANILAMHESDGTELPCISYRNNCCQRTGLASFGGAKGLLGTLKGTSGQGGDIMTGHQQNCFSCVYSSASLSEPSWASLRPAQQSDY